MTHIVTRTYHRFVETTSRKLAPASSAPVPWAFLLATRPKQWIKNLVIYLPLFFTVNEAWEFDDVSTAASMLGRSTAAFLLFSAISSAMYLVNDVADRVRDRRHPRKRLRSIAAGHLTPAVAWTGAGILVSGGMALSYVLEPAFALAAGIYVAIMLTYTFVLKRVLFLDVAAISAGFMLRVVGGAAAIEVPISEWLYICTGLGALFIALAKRHGELETAGQAAPGQRDILSFYTPQLLSRLMLATVGATVIAYAVYSLTAENLPANHTMSLTIPFVLFGLLRYTYLVRARKIGENPEDVLMSDRPLMSAVAMWLATAATILAVFR